MTFREGVRIGVLRTNAIWPFSVLNRLPYALAIRCFKSVCLRFPEIRSVYLRHSLVADAWTPAISDIDLTVIFSSGLPREREFSFLQNFWKQMTGLQRMFPMLGEIEVLSETQLVSWARFGIEGRGAVEWQLLAGADTVAKPPRPVAARYLREAFDYTCWFYLQNFTRVFSQRSTSPYLRTKDLQRLQQKTSRCLAAMSRGECGRPVGISEPGTDEVGILLNILSMLEQGLQSTGLEPGQWGRTSNLRQQWLLRQASGRGRSINPPVSDDAFSGWGSEIRSIYLDRDELVYVILKGAAHSSANRKRIMEIQEYFTGQDRSPIFLTENLFVYLLRFLKPYDFVYFARNASLLYGDPILEGVDLPDPVAFQHDLVKQTPLLLMYPQSQEFICAADAEIEKSRDFELKLEQALALKLYLERGIIKPSIARVQEDYAVEYPHHADAIRTLRLNQPGHTHNASVWERFVFLKDVTEDICAGLAADDTWEKFKQS